MQKRAEQSSASAFLGLIKLTGPASYLRLERRRSSNGTSCLHIGKWSPAGGYAWGIELSWSVTGPAVVALLHSFSAIPGFLPPDPTAEDLGRLLYSVTECAYSVMPPEGAPSETRW